MVEQIDKFAYCNSMFFGHEIGEQLAAELIRGTDGAMSKAYFMCSGSEAMESAMKMARQYYMELSPQEPKRINFIAREGSYHGTTLGSLSMSGHVARRSLFLDLLLPNIAKVSACNPYRGMMVGQTTEEYVVQLADELDRKFQDLGPDTTLGCVPAVPGYFKAMKSVCDKYGALLIFDEVMSGMGRSGTLHAWQQEHVVPDIQTIAKGLGGGYAPMAVGCAAALEVQRIIREEELVSNVQKQGVILEKLLRKYLDDHPYVGNIRGKGLFWGNGILGDHVLLAPAYTSTSDEIEYIAARTRDAVRRTFDELSADTDTF
ncbi:aminotransferase [Colletotrichum tofieldiae]|nr:aminotransferase [Colletotrichum tofieldiae]